MMGRGPKYKVPRRRRREGKTDYHRRYRMVVSGRLRLVVRRTNKYVEAKIVKFNPAGDETLVSSHSIELIKKFGWKGSGKSLPAAYLTGLLLGRRARARGIEEAVVDIGLFRSVRGNRLYATVRGAIDAGLNIPVSEEVLPPEDRIRGEHVAEYAKKIKTERPESFRRLFSSMLSRGLDPEGIVSHFYEIKNKILGGEIE